MSAIYRTGPVPAWGRARAMAPPAVRWRPDPWLLSSAMLLLGLGWVMVASASITLADRRFGEPLYYLVRQSVFIGIGLSAGWFAFRASLARWERWSPVFFLIGVVALALVLVPGLGREVNGAMRWLRLGPVNLQPSELMKLCAVLYTAGYIVRRAPQLRARLSGFIKPLGLMAGVALLLLAEPDFGAAAVLLATVLTMLFLGGVRMWQVGLVCALGAGLLWWLIVTSPYRLERLTTFLNPWADPFNSGFQLTQALIAFGRGEWLGVGLGASVQKLFYLPEAHTDFLLAVLAEELGLLGVTVVVALFGVLAWRAFAIGARAERVGLPFGAHLAWGLGTCIGLQALVNIAVNMGALPTKGLTLPLMSYGGSSICVACVMVALLLRVDFEGALAEAADARGGVRWRAG